MSVVCDLSRTAALAAWQSARRSTARTKAYLTLDGPAIAADVDAARGRQTGEGAAERSDPGERSPPGDEYDAVDGPSGGDRGGDRSPFDVGEHYGRRKRLGFVLGPAAFGLIALSPTPAGLTQSGEAVAAVTAWVTIWWMSEAVPIPAASLLPVVLFPATGALPVAATAPSYADPLVFLFVGGFFLAVAMQRWGLHRRIALGTIAAVGRSPERLILGFMIATAFLSMWISNSATVMLMMPIALAVIDQTAALVETTDREIATAEGEFSFGVALMLCIAYSASVGGVGTLIGTPPNILFAGQASELFGQGVSFVEWMLYGLPIAVIGVVAVYLYT